MKKYLSYHHDYIIAIYIQNMLASGRVGLNPPWLHLVTVTPLAILTKNVRTPAWLGAPPPSAP